MAEFTRRIDQLLEPDFVARVDDLSVEELHARLHDALEEEVRISFLRRAAQGRIDLLRAELQRRESGGQLGDLVKALPQILADKHPLEVRKPKPFEFAPSFEHPWRRGREPLIFDTTVARLPVLSLEDIQRRLEELCDVERAAGTVRRALHAVIDALSARAS